nr:organomercurial lyase [Streptomyces sp. WAC00263]
MPVTPAGLAQGDPGRGSPPSSATPPRSPSPCQATGDPVRLTATPDGPTNVEPATAVESIVTPHARTTVRASFCNQRVYCGRVLWLWCDAGHFRAR